MHCSVRAAAITIGSFVIALTLTGVGPHTPPAASASGVPDLVIDRDGPVSDAVLAARKAREVVPCRRCHGTRRVVKREKTGEHRLPGMTQNLYREVEADCDACLATGYNDLKWIVGTDRRLGVLDRYIGAVARLDPDDPRAREAINESRKELDELMAINPVEWTNRVVNPQAKRRLSAVTLDIGAPVLAVGILLSEPYPTGDGAPLRRIKLIDYRISPSEFMTRYNARSLRMIAERWISEGLVAVIEQPEIIVSDPLLVDAIPGEIVMATGLLAGAVSEGGIRQPVLQHGFVITPRPELAFDDK